MGWNEKGKEEGEEGKGKGKEEEEDGEKRGNAIVARTSTSNRSLKGGWVSLDETQRKEGNSPYTSVLATVGGVASLLRRPGD